MLGRFLKKISLRAEVDLDDLGFEVMYKMGEAEGGGFVVSGLPAAGG